MTDGSFTENQTPKSLRIVSETKGVLVEISLIDGALTCGEDYSPNEVAQAFWSAISLEYREFLQWKAAGPYAAVLESTGGKFTFEPDVVGRTMERPMVLLIQNLTLKADGIIHAELRCDYHLAIDRRGELEDFVAVTRPIEDRPVTPNWPNPEPGDAAKNQARLEEIRAEARRAELSVKRKAVAAVIETLTPHLDDEGLSILKAWEASQQ